MGVTASSGRIIYGRAIENDPCPHHVRITRRVSDQERLVIGQWLDDHTTGHNLLRQTIDRDRSTQGMAGHRVGLAYCFEHPQAAIAFKLRWV